MHIRRTIKHTDDHTLQPYVRDNFPVNFFHEQDQMYIGFKRGNLKRVTFELDNNYTIIYEKVEDNNEAPSPSHEEGS